MKTTIVLFVIVFITFVHFVFAGPLMIAISLGLTLMYMVENVWIRWRSNARANAIEKRLDDALKEHKKQKEIFDEMFDDEYRAIVNRIKEKKNPA